MAIKRVNAGPRMSGAVVHGDTVYVAGQVADTSGADVTEGVASLVAWGRVATYRVRVQLAPADDLCGTAICYLAVLVDPGS